jgi:hypothetical protein
MGQIIAQLLFVEYFKVLLLFGKISAVKAVALLTLEEDARSAVQGVFRVGQFVRVFFLSHVAAL